ncbi:hypothetical protein U1Q18_033235 [Sarracenia purpurea var. burkii]
MYGHNNYPIDGYTAAVAGRRPLLDQPNFPAARHLPAPLFIPAARNVFDPMLVPPKREVVGIGYGASSGFGSPSLIQRSVTSHSLQKINDNGFCQLVLTAPAEFLDPKSRSPVRKVFSTGDLELETVKMAQHWQRSESPFTNENTIITESISKACRYSPLEKKERIERYRSKRNQRNFNKKIKYECRKTLADSRPRIRGRFARSNEAEKSSQNRWSRVAVEEDDDNWINFLDSFSANLIP